MKKVTIYIPCFNYAEYLSSAIESVMAQTMSDWELILIDDGSTDHTPEILKKYENHPNVKAIVQDNKGLNITNNIALRLSEGKYIMRLDADDYLDENALVVMTNYLDRHPDIGLVFPDFYHVNQKGRVTEVVRRKKIGQEVFLLDRPAHGACTMFRREVLVQIGGYAEEFSCQDGYEIWLKFIQKYRPHNINIPLFYYRKHGSSLTQNSVKILETRREIQKKFVETHLQETEPSVVGIIPVIRNKIYTSDDPFTLLDGKPLLWYTLNAAVQSKKLDKVVVSSDDDEVLDFARTFEGVLCLRRDSELAPLKDRIEDLLKRVLNQLENAWEYSPDAVSLLYINSPLRHSRHIDSAIDTMTIFSVDSVISVEEELSYCYQHGELGLEPLKQSDRSVRLERDALFKENGAVYVTKSSIIKKGKFLGESIGHMMMLSEESLRIKSKFDLWMAEKIIQDWKQVSVDTPVE